MTLTEGLLAPREPLVLDEMFKEGLTILTSAGATFIISWWIYVVLLVVQISFSWWSRSSSPGGLDLVLLVA